MENTPCQTPLRSRPGHAEQSPHGSVGWLSAGGPLGGNLCVSASVSCTLDTPQVAASAVRSARGLESGLRFKADDSLPRSQEDEAPQEAKPQPPARSWSPVGRPEASGPPQICSPSQSGPGLRPRAPLQCTQRSLAACSRVGAGPRWHQVNQLWCRLRSRSPAVPGAEDAAEDRSHWPTQQSLSPAFGRSQPGQWFESEEGRSQSQAASQLQSGRAASEGAAGPGAKLELDTSGPLGKPFQEMSLGLQWLSSHNLVTRSIGAVQRLSSQGKKRGSSERGDVEVIHLSSQPEPSQVSRGPSQANLLGRVGAWLTSSSRGKRQRAETQPAEAALTLSDEEPIQEPLQLPRPSAEPLLGGAKTPEPARGRRRIFSESPVRPSPARPLEEDAELPAERSCEATELAAMPSEQCKEPSQSFIPSAPHHGSDDDEIPPGQPSPVESAEGENRSPAPGAIPFRLDLTAAPPEAPPTEAATAPSRDAAEGVSDPPSCGPAVPLPQVTRSPVEELLSNGSNLGSPVQGKQLPTVQAEVELLVEGVPCDRVGSRDVSTDGPGPVVVSSEASSVATTSVAAVEEGGVTLVSEGVKGESFMESSTEQEVVRGLVKEGLEADSAPPSSAKAEEGQGSVCPSMGLVKVDSALPSSAKVEEGQGPCAAHETGAAGPAASDHGEGPTLGVADQSPSAAHTTSTVCASEVGPVPVVDNSLEPAGSQEAAAPLTPHCAKKVLPPAHEASVRHEEALEVTAGAQKARAPAEAALLPRHEEAPSPKVSPSDVQAAPSPAPPSPKVLATAATPGARAAAAPLRRSESGAPFAQAKEALQQLPSLSHCHLDESHPPKHHAECTGPASYLSAHRVGLGQTEAPTLSNSKQLTQGRQPFEEVLFTVSAPGTVSVGTAHMTVPSGLEAAAVCHKTTPAAPGSSCTQEPSAAPVGRQTKKVDRLWLWTAILGPELLEL